MEDQQPMEDSQPPINNSDDGISSINQINHLPNPSDSNVDGESGHNLSAGKVKGALEITASTGKFWLEWEELKNMLYFQLKQVLSEYPEAKMGDGQQNSALGESYSQLVKRLEEALFSFIEGPPFTLQRLSEILLDARTIYPNLSKLALALEKNLLVTSTLTKSTDPYPPTNVQPEEQAKDMQSQPESEHHEPEPEHHQPESEHHEPEPEHHQPEPEHKQPEAEHHQAEPEQKHPVPEHQIPEPKKSDLVPTSVENGEEPGDKDEVMAEADADAEADAATTMDMETTEEIVPPSDTNPEPATGS